MEQEINALKAYINLAEELIKLGNKMVKDATAERDTLQRELNRLKPPQGVINA
jgi:hypothetical protein